MIVGIDPGRNVGVAFVTEDGRLEHARVITPLELDDFAFPDDATVVIGDSTGSRDLQAVLRRRSIPFALVDERNTSLLARDLYFRDHPPRGFARLLPRGLRSPPGPVDGYAAYAIALRFLEQSQAKDEQAA